VGGRATPLNAADQPTQLADRVLEQVGVGGVVDVGLDHGGVDPQLPGPQQLVVAQLAEQRLVELPDDPRAAATEELDRVVGCGTGWSSGMRQNRRHEIESVTSRHRLS
jgi:hypothetical protein